MIKYVFWDCDNTLVQNGQIHWEKHVAVLARYGITLDKKYHQQFYHNNGKQNWKLLVDDLGFSVPCQTYLTEIDDWYHAQVVSVPLRDGVDIALDYFQHSGARQCVVTNARQSSVLPMLASKKLMHYFDFVLCKEDYVNRKPHPMPYLTALARMEELHGAPIDKSSCLAIEDDPYGVAAAHAAGIPVLHRCRDEGDPPAPGCAASVYTGPDFLSWLKIT